MAIFFLLQPHQEFENVQLTVRFLFYFPKPSKIFYFAHQQKYQLGISMESLEVRSRKNRKRFAILLIVVQIIVTALFSVFYREKPSSEQFMFKEFYPKFQDANAMILIGFGCAYCFMKRFQLTSLCYIFFMHALGCQIYVMLRQFWVAIYEDGWGDGHFYFVERFFTGAFFSMAALLMGTGVILGRTGPLELVIFIIVGEIGYSLNEEIAFKIIEMYDYGGSTSIHLFGACMGLATSFVLYKKHPISLKIQVNRSSMMLSTLGAFFLWPSYLTSYNPAPPFIESLVFANILMALTGSVIGAFATSILVHKKIHMADVATGTLCGGITAAPAGILVNPSGSILLGIIASSLCVICYAKLSEKVERVLGIPDIAGSLNLHGVTCFFSGLYTGVIFLIYSAVGVQQKYKPYLSFFSKGFQRTLVQQAGIQFAGTFIAMGISIVCGLIAGLIMLPFYHYRDSYDFVDENYFQDYGEQKKPFKAQETLIIKMQDSFIVNLFSENKKDLVLFSINDTSATKMQLVVCPSQ